MGDFENAVDDISNKVNKTMTDDELKEIYALYKQATVGDINTSRPGMLDFKVLEFNAILFIIWDSCHDT